MNENLIAGYAAFTTSDEYGAALGSSAPGTWTPTLIFISATAGTAASSTIENHC